MRVGFNIDTNISNNASGRYKFIIRLANEFRRRGVEVNNKKHDVFVGLPKLPFSLTAKINILRLDGITFNTKKKVYKKRIKELFKSIEKSDALVYQGEFCKQAHEKFLGVKSKRHKIISNGVDPGEFLPRAVKNYFLASCKWRPRKRLKDVIQSFLMALDMGLDSDLIVCGGEDYRVEHERITYLGWQSGEELKHLLSEAIASLHFAWLDCFPNSMVESIVAGCPVIYTMSGGQAEVGKDSGIAIKDKEWDFKAYDSNVPPPIDIREAAEAFLEIKENKIERPDLDIREVCNQYIEFFKELL